MMPPQDQNSMVLNPSLGSNDSSEDSLNEIMQVVNIPDDDEAAIQNLSIIPYQPPLINLDPIHLGNVKVFVGPALPPTMVWKHSFKNLMQEIAMHSVPGGIHILALPFAQLPKGDWVDL